MTTPMIVLAFANDPDEHLQMLARERRSIEAALRDADDRRHIRLKSTPDARVDDLFDQFNRYGAQIAIFHYGGHASGTALKLEDAAGGNEAAQAGGLARLMGISESLQLVFLNGCATQGQVKQLLDSGVNAVIATAVAINDAMATDFAETFYEALAGGKTIGQSFESARGMIETRYADRGTVGEFRAMSFGEKGDGGEATLAWGLYLGAEGQATKAWKLPEQAEDQVIVRGAAFTAADGQQDSAALIQTLINAVAEHSAETKEWLEFARRTGRDDFRGMRQEILDSFPAPVGEQLRKLFASTSIDEPRLRQLVLTYETVIKLLCFASLSQLWNELFDKPDSQIPDDVWQRIEAFKTLDESAERTFDYLGLTVAIYRTLVANGVEPFMVECATLQQEMTDSEAALARKFMDEMRAELAGGRVEPNEIESFCVQAERHLGTLMADVAFLARYKMATIKNIQFKQTRHKPAQFRHSQVPLSRLSAELVDGDAMVRVTPTDSESVILLKDQAGDSPYLNLTPFLIDENALLGFRNTKIYFYSHHDAAADAYHYYSIADPSDRRVISAVIQPDLKEGYLPIKAQLEEFKQVVARK